MAGPLQVLSIALTFRHPTVVRVADGIVDFDYAFIQTSQLTSVQQLTFKLWQAILLIVLGALLCLSIVLASVGIPLLVLGVLMLIRRHNVILSGSDGRVYAIQTPTHAFAMDLVAQLRTTVAARETAPSYTVNIQAGTIEKGAVDLSTTAITNSAGAVAVHGDASGELHTHATGAARGSGAAAGVPTAAIVPAFETPPAQPAYAFTAATGGRAAAQSEPAGRLRPAAARPAADTQSLRRAEPAQASTPVDVRTLHSPGAVSIGGSARGASISTSAAVSISTAVNHDLEAIIQLLVRNNVPHRDQLVEMLRITQHYAQAGPSEIEATRTSWADFAQYALSYLTGIEGLVGLIERVQRMLG